MSNTKLDRMLVRQQALKDAIRQEKHHARQRKQKALFGVVRRAGLLDLTDDEIEAALQSYRTLQGQDDSGGGAQT